MSFSLPLSFALFFFLSFSAHAMQIPAPADCDQMEYWDFTSGMCLPLAMDGMEMKMVMAHGNSFFTQTFETGPRGRTAFSVPDMLMADYGSSVGASHYVNLELMLTAEKWAVPKDGYPELLQIGEDKQNGSPFLDAQHPHSSPIMGLSVSDTISLAKNKDHLKVWFAPRGESTDGPVSFMHRPTGMVNPDAPLGHHIGQDVGHISSTVIGGSAALSSTTLEASAFHGAEPEPLKVDLPIGNPNSYSARVTHAFSPHFTAMVSAAFVKSPEPARPDLDHVWRYSASAYSDHSCDSGWNIHQTFIWGMIKGYDQASVLHSFAKEFVAQKNSANIWGRLEVLQRTPGELLLTGVSDANKGRWVAAATLGYTHDFIKSEDLALGLGGSVTKDFLPNSYQGGYGGNPWTGKIFVQLSGMKMWEL